MRTATSLQERPRSIVDEQLADAYIFRQHRITGVAGLLSYPPAGDAGLGGTSGKLSAQTMAGVPIDVEAEGQYPLLHNVRDSPT